jgi:hypothetical protein
VGNRGGQCWAVLGGGNSLRALYKLVEPPPSGIMQVAYLPTHTTIPTAAARRRRRGGGTRRRSIRMPYNIRSCTTNSCVWGPWVAYLANLHLPESLVKSHCGQLAWQLLNTCRCTCKGRGCAPAGECAAAPRAPARSCAWPVARVACRPTAAAAPTAGLGYRAGLLASQHPASKTRGDDVCQLHWASGKSQKKPPRQ